MRKRKNKKQVRLIIGLSICLLLIMTAGYAAFNTNLTLLVKANIYNIKDKCFTTADNGDNAVIIIDYDQACGSDVVIPEKIKGKTVTTISDTVWNSYKVFNHKGLTSVVIPDTVTYIGSNAFWGNNISNVKFGNRLEVIKSEAFASNSLKQLSFPPSLTYIGTGAFYNNYLTSLPALDNINYKSGAFALNSITGNEAFVYGRKSDGTIDYTTLNSYAGRSPSNFVLPGTIKTIAYYALRGLNVETLNLPGGIETLEAYSLMQLKATTLNIPSSIKNIAKYAINESANVKTINIDRKINTISGAPWGATNTTVNWTGTN